jgi:hypothetical protein
MHGIHLPAAVAPVPAALRIKLFRRLLKPRPIKTVRPTARLSMAASDVERVLWEAWLEFLGK